MSDGASPSASTAARDWPLVGREPELGQIAAARADPGCPGVVLSGVRALEVGIGLFTGDTAPTPTPWRRR